MKTKDGQKIVIKYFALIFLFFYGITSLFSFYKNRIGTEIYGNVDIREVDLGFRVPGKLQDIYIKEGDYVYEGQILAKLDQKPVMEDILMAEATLKLNEASLKNANMNFEMINDLYKMNIKSKYEYLNALMQVEQARANIDFAKAKISSIRISLDDTILFSPSDGIVTSRSLEKGTILSPNSKVVTLSLLNDVYVKGYVTEPVIGKLKIGNKVEIFTDSGYDFEAIISYVSPNAEFTPKTIETRELRTDLVYKVHFRVDNHRNMLHKGMPVTIKIKFT